MKILSVLISFLVITTTHQCARKPLFNAVKPAADSTYSISVYAIESFPTLKKEQYVGYNYFADYKINDTLKIAPQEGEKIKNILADSTNFTSQNIKQCPFIAKYGLVVDKGKQGFTNYILSGENCAKLQVTNSADTAKTIYLDVINNTIYTSLKQQ